MEKKQVMFGEQMFEKVYPASITKIMTAILAVKYGNMDDTVTITEEDYHTGRRIPDGGVCRWRYRYYG